MNVLVVKLTSMGDLIQALPAFSDALRAYPELRFDWVVDEAFAEIPSWHPAVERVLTTAHRRWRSPDFWLRGEAEIRTFRRQLRARHYRAVIDAQTNWKSALVTRFALGPRHGPDRHSVREWVAHLAYQHRYPVPKYQLAISRWRALFAQILDYPPPQGVPDFGLHRRQWPPAPVTLPEAPFLVFVQNASWPNKRWVDQHWSALLSRAASEGYSVVLPWGSAAERAQAEALAASHRHARVLPRLSLSELAGVLSRSAGAVCVDTGLAHLAAALDVATVTLYGATDPTLIAATGPAALHLRTEGYACAPCYKRRCETGGYVGEQALCMETIDATQVWNALEKAQALADNPQPISVTGDKP